MTSERETAANRLNARKSSGPRTPASKAIASRNALRHGLAALVHKHPVLSAEIEGLAEALCDGDDDPTLFAQVLIIGRNALVLRTISAQQIGVIERLADPSAIALAKGDNSLKLGKAHSRKCKRAFKRAYCAARVSHEKYKDELPPPTEAERMEEARGGYPFIPSRLNSFLCDKEHLAANEPDDSAPVASALRNLRIATKEQLWRRPREPYPPRSLRASGVVAAEAAILAFINIKLMKGLERTDKT